MDFTSGDWLTIVVMIAGFASVWGGLQARIKALEKKVEIHNGLVERMVAVECRSKSNTHRIDDLESE